jgi:hypothetical protein
MLGLKTYTAAALVIFVVCKDDVYIYGQISVQDEHFVFKVG